MKIKTSTNEIEVSTIVSTNMKSGTKTYPALKFVFPSGVSADEISAMLEGSFDIIDDNNNVAGTYEGYNTHKETAVIIGKITTAEQQIEELEAELAAAQEANAELQETVDIIVNGEVE